MGVDIVVPQASIGNLISLLDPANNKVRWLAWHNTDSAWAGSGSVQSQYPNYVDLRTGATASSTARVSMPTNLLNFAQSGNMYAIDWSKKITLMFDVCRTVGSDTQVETHIQLCNTNTAPDDLTAVGIGLVIDNLAMKGETYDTEREEVDLSTTMTLLKSYAVKIVHDHSAGKVEWFVDGVSKGSSTREPTALADAFGFLVAGIKNGVAGGTDCRAQISPIWLAIEG